MTYKLIFDEKVIRTLEKMDFSLRERIVRKIQQTKENPVSYFERLSERTDYKLRVGNYRVIADIDFSNQTIYITQIGHRKNIYQ